MANDFASLRAEYADLWQRMQIRPERAAAVNTIANKLIALKPRYQQVSAMSGVSWAVIAVLHQREASADFAGVLHNGEKIIGTGRVTRLVPAGRGPFSTWEESAIDALTAPPHSLQKVSNWTIERVCYEIERYNGFGYRNQHPEVKSPYLWSFTTIYASGKYVADGLFSSSEVDKQCGTMPILKRIMELDASVRFDGSDFQVAVQQPGVLQIGSMGVAVQQLQTALAGQGFNVGEIDGEFGPNTQAAVMAFQASRGLPGTGIADQGTLNALGSTSAAPGGTLKQDDVLVLLLNLLKARQGSATPAPAPPESATNPLQIILGALLGRQTDASAANAPILSPIDKMLGGEALAGKKTALSVVAYVVMAILKAAGVVSAASPWGQVVTIVIAAFGALGGTAKIDRVIQSLGVIAAKPK